MGRPSMDHEEGSLDWGHNSVHQHPVELQHCALLPPQVFLHHHANNQNTSEISLHRQHEPLLIATDRLL